MNNLSVAIIKSAIHQDLNNLSGNNRKKRDRQTTGRMLLKRERERQEKEISARNEIPSLTTNESFHSLYFSLSWYHRHEFSSRESFMLLYLLFLPVKINRFVWFSPFRFTRTNSPRATFSMRRRDEGLAKWPLPVDIVLTNEISYLFLIFRPHGCRDEIRGRRSNETTTTTTTRGRIQQENQSKRGRQSCPSGISQRVQEWHSSQRIFSPCFAFLWVVKGYSTTNLWFENQVNGQKFV